MFGGKIKAIDLFAGAGGFSLAALNVGVDVLAAVEFDQSACATYTHNLVKNKKATTKVYPEDILELDPEDFRKELKLEVGELDFLMGGPPCQGFSKHRILDRGVDDPRNKLLIRYFDFVRELKPKVFLVENVPGLLWKRHELHLQKFKNLSRANGYRLLGPIKVNAKDYGVPQNRQRVFILGVRTDCDSSDVVWPPESTHFKPGTKKPEWKTASTVFEPAPKTRINDLKKVIGKELAESLTFGQPMPKVSEDPAAIHMNHTQALRDRFIATPINGGREDIAFRLKCHADGYVGHKDVYGRIRLGQPGPTMTTGCFNPSKGRFLHPWKNHGITIRHAARFQTFPDDFVFSAGITSQGAQVGNAVPVLLGEVMIKEAVKCANITQIKNNNKKTA
ncbi:MAG: DNA (cytosine-5)-methyltransferase 1 [Candidatus Endobugula sp.]|jgi:DNA (cytosine-5)-methyltransferase 1